MGLDMFLFDKDRKEIAYWRKANAIHKWFDDNLANGEIVNCRKYRVSKKDLEKLKDVCEYVLNSINLVPGKLYVGGRRIDDGNYEDIYVDGMVIENPEIAQELLPTQPGFFFGNTNYSEYYVDKLKDTISQINTILETFDFSNNQLYYAASW